MHAGPVIANSTPLVALWVLGRLDLLRDLHGEALALAEECDARLVLMDERKGRRFALRLGIPLTGTMGLLLLAKELGIIANLAPLLADLVDAGLYLAPDLSARVLRLAGEL
jgi:uncharacterized protein